MRISACDFNYIVTFAVGEMLDGKLNVERSDTRGIYQPTRKLVVKVADTFSFRYILHKYLPRWLEALANCLRIYM